MVYWLIKSEPFKYSWDQFETEKNAVWDGVRNYGARNNLRNMKMGEEAFFYHSNQGMAIVGIAKVVKEFYQDPTTENPNWVVVEFEPVRRLKIPVTLAMVKADIQLEKMDLVRLGRLSVGAVTNEEWQVVLDLAGEIEAQ